MNEMIIAIFDRRTLNSRNYTLLYTIQVNHNVFAPHTHTHTYIHTNTQIDLNKPKT